MTYCIRIHWLARIAFALVVIVNVDFLLAQLEYDTESGGQPGAWPPVTDKLPCCLGDGWTRFGVQNNFELFLDRPLIGYPMRGSLFTQLNDTLSVLVSFENRSDNPFTLTGSSPEKWFFPRVYQDFPSDNSAYLLRDSTDLDWRIRGWYQLTGRGWTRSSHPQSFAARHTFWAIIVDVWNLPTGTQCLCIDTASVSSPGFNKIKFGDVYEYRKAHSLADSVNAYEACYWRAEQDSNLSAMEFWSDKILEINSNSVPGWWIKSKYNLAAKDTAEAKLALDKALSHLAAGDDRAMAGYGNTPIREAEHEYRDWCQFLISRDRELLGP